MKAGRIPGRDTANLVYSWEEKAEVVIVVYV